MQQRPLPPGAIPLPKPWKAYKLGTTTLIREVGSPQVYEVLWTHVFPQHVYIMSRELDAVHAVEIEFDKRDPLIKQLGLQDRQP